jgi:hypothetical protein
MRMRNIAICSLPGYKNVFPHHLINGMIFEKYIIEHEKIVLIFPV